ncbi:MAG: helix-turn-helix domain-containing protein [Pseudomonadota bacterium]
MSDKTIKSVRRVFEILELFDRHRAPLAAKEIARELDYPLTSAHALLKSMHDLGYANYNAEDWTYTPSRNLVAKIEWVREYLERDSRMLDMITRLNEETRETINLSRLTGDQVKIVHGLECRHPVGVSVREGLLMPAVDSLTGLTALSALAGERLDNFLQIYRPEAGNLEMLETVRTELQERGTVAIMDLFIQGIGAVCMPVKGMLSEDILVIGVVGPSERIREKQRQHRQTLKRLTRQFGVKPHFALRNPR